MTTVGGSEHIRILSGCRTRSFPSALPFCVSFFVPPVFGLLKTFFMVVCLGSSVISPVGSRSVLHTIAKSFPKPPKWRGLDDGEGKLCGLHSARGENLKDMPSSLVGSGDVAWKVIKNWGRSYPHEDVGRGKLFCALDGFGRRMLFLGEAKHPASSEKHQEQKRVLIQVKEAMVIIDIYQHISTHLVEVIK